MKLMRFSGAFAFAIAAAACFFVPAAPAQSGSDHLVLAPEELKWSDVPSLPRGAKLAVIEGSLAKPGPFTVRLRFPDGYRVPPHFHPAVERVTVLAGTFVLGMGSTTRAHATPLRTGSIAIMPPGTVHFVRIEGETIIQLHGTGPWGITYVNPDDDPRNQ